MEITYALQDIDSVAKTLIKNLDSKIVLFYGEMGSGKTTLIKHIVAELGGNKNEVTSPTYALVNEYEVENDLVYHFDFYRINSEEEAFDIGLEDYLSKKCWVFIEWPNKVEKLLPFIGKNVYLVRKNDGFRTLKLEKKKI